MRDLDPVYLKKPIPKMIRHAKDGSGSGSGSGSGTASRIISSAVRLHAVRHSI